MLNGVVAWHDVSSFVLNGVVAWHDVSSFVLAFETRVEHSIPSRRTYYRQSTRGAEGLGPVSRLSSVVSRSTRQVSVSGRSFTLSILNNDSFFSVGRPGRTPTRSNRSRWVGCRRENRSPLRRAAFFARLHSSNAERKQNSSCAERKQTHQTPRENRLFMFFHVESQPRPGALTPGSERTPVREYEHA